MNQKTSTLKKVLYIFILLVLVAIVVIKLKRNKEISQSKVYHYDKEQAFNVQADTLQIENVHADFSYSGTFESNKETRISAEMQGKIMKVLVDVGSVVSKGQPLVLLDNSLLKLQLESIEVQIEGLDNDVNRYTILAKSDAIQGVQLEKAKLGLKSAKVQKATLLEQINKTTIKAPFNGVVTAKLNEEGAFAAPGVPLLQITDITNLKFIINVSENELSKFTLSQSYLLNVDAYAELSLTGKATMIGSKANMGSSFSVHFTLTNTADLKIKSGMFGKVSSLPFEKNKQRQEIGIIISSSAIVGSENQPQVYLIKNGQVFLQNIVVSKKIKNKSVVAYGLKPGEVIVTNGFINLYDGANVTVK